ncbi:SNF2-related protein [Candidatus Methanarcanum hacksteinii]|uniref:SNF2-related protein n=1 Tax=Candidatus Methanarcanum hacksteinii TaxID=2911857 RepID=UPI0037DD5306
MSGLEKFINSPVFRIRLKYYFKDVGTFPMALDDDLSINRLKEFIKDLSDFAFDNDAVVRTTKDFDDYLEKEENHINERRRVGMDIKAHHENIEIGMSEFKGILDANMSQRPLTEMQLWDAYYMTVMKKVCNFSVPGSGKTATTLGMYSFLKVLGKVDRLLMIGPINSFGSWLDEFESCFGDPPRYFNIQEDKGMGVQGVELKLKFDSKATELFLFNYESLDKYAQIVKKFVVDDRTMVVLDEVHRIKSISGVRAAETMDVVKEVRYLVSLTGTPIPNNYTDIYNMFNMTLGLNYKDLMGFEKNELKNPSPDVKARINESIQPFFCRTTKEALGVPPADPEILYQVMASDEECRLFSELRIFLGNNQLSFFIRALQMESDQRMIYKALDDNIINFLDLDESGPINRKGLESQHHDVGMSSKMKKCLEIVDGLIKENKNVIVWCIFKDSIRTISEKLRDMGISSEVVYGDIPVIDRHQILNKFKSGQCQVLVANPHTLAESVSLHSVCHDAVYYEYTHNLVHFLQSKDRIHRLGLPQGQYTRFHIIYLDYGERVNPGSLDLNILNRLHAKEDIMYAAIERGELEIMPSEEEDLRLILGEYFKSYR